MSELGVWLILLLDNAHHVVIVTFIMIIIITAVIIVASEREDDVKITDAVFSKLKKTYKKILVLFAIIVVIIWILPSSKEVLIIHGCPKMTNSSSNEITLKAEKFTNLYFKIKYNECWENRK